MVSRILAVVNKFIGFDSAQLKINNSPPRRLKTTFGAVLVFALAAVAITIISVAINSQTFSPTSVVATPISASEAPTNSDVSYGELFIHVVGDVAQPGIYEIPAGSRVFDALMAAGGVLGKTEPCGLNLAREVKDGEQLIVRSASGGCEPESDEASSDLISINTSDVNELDSLPGIGPTLADRIIAWRETNGSFTSIEQLDDVSGIGEKLFLQIRDLVTL